MRCFPLVFILVVIGGAELFTGNNMIVMAWASRKVTTRALLLNWVVAFAGNAVGAIATAALMFLTMQYSFGSGSVGLVALTTANAKVSLTFISALTLGIMCNALVCLAVWMCYGARTTIDRVVTIVPPIAAFCDRRIRAQHRQSLFRTDSNLHQVGRARLCSGKRSANLHRILKLSHGEISFVGNLLPVTIGNIIGGSVMVAAVYWFVYLRKASSV